MTDNFPTCLAVTLKQEGGFSNNPHDPGHATNLGVTKAVWEAWVGHPVSIADMHALTVADVTPLYRVRYWNATGCDKLPAPLALCVFDFAVNSGGSRAAGMLQKLIGVTVDGHIGPATLAAVAPYLVRHGLQDAIDDYQAMRSHYDAGLPGAKIFGKDWQNRVAAVKAAAYKLGGFA